MELENTLSTPFTQTSDAIPVCELLDALFGPEPFLESRAAMILTASTFPFAAFLNGLTLLAFYKNPSLRKPANVFLIALVIADFIKSAVASPMYIILYGLYKNMNQQNCLLLEVFFNTTLYLPSLFLLASLNIERFISIKAPFWHRANITKNILVKIAVAGSVLALIISFLRKFNKGFLYLFAASTLGSSVFTLVFAVLIWWTLKKRSKVDITTTAARHRYKNQRKTSKNPGEHFQMENMKDCRQDFSELQIDLPDVSASKEKNCAAFQLQNSKEKERDVFYSKSNRHARIFSSRKLSIDEESSSYQKPRNFPLEVKVVVKKDGKFNPDIQENIEEIEENKLPSDKASSSCQTPGNCLLKVQVMAKKDEKDSISLSEIEEIKENKEIAEKHRRRERNRLETRRLPTMSITHSVQSHKSERKAAKVAIFLVIGVFFTAIIPVCIILAFYNFDFKSSAIALVPGFLLLSSLVDPIINIGMNNNIRQACWKLIK